MLKRLFFCGIIFFLISCQKKKEEILFIDYSINTSYDFTKALFLNDKAILIGGEHFNVSMIYQLENNGQVNEIKIENEQANKQLTAISQANDGTLMTVGYNGKILISKDSGTHWDFVQSNTWFDFLGIDFNEKDSAYIVAGAPFNIGQIATCNQFGEGARTAQEEFNFVIEDIKFLSNHIGYLCGYGAVMKSYDDGNTWEYLDAKDDYFKAMSWENEKEGVVVGYEGCILQTQDGGKQWHIVRNGNNPLLQKIHFKDVANNGAALYVAVGEQGKLMMSTNYGKSWSMIKSFTQKDLNGVCFKNENECLVVGSSGSIFLLKFE